jgi:N-acetylglucosaminyldiphosphoundecaprenol N-acetyl-beta-D-mannosaminyltransferase
MAHVREELRATWIVRRDIPSAGARRPTSIRVPLLDVLVTPATASEVAAMIVQSARSRRRLWVANYNLHAVYLEHSDQLFASYGRNADLILIDGWPVLLAARLKCRSLRGSHRIGSSDWLDALVEVGEPLTVLAVGATPESCSRASDFFNARTNLTWHGVDGFEFRHRPSDGPVLTVENLIELADLVVVGLGMPHQERWILSNEHLLRRKVVANVGGCIDYYSGAQRVAPRGLGRYGVEWLYRLLRDPRRLWSRYTLEPVKLAILLLMRCPAVTRLKGRGR